MSPATPLDIVRQTPGSNCGQCGYPTCLAFAAALVATGIDPGCCPYLDRRGLDLPLAAAGSLDEVARQRDLALVEHLKAKVAALDFKGLAEPLGAGWSITSPDTLFFSFVGQEVVIGKTGLLINGRAPEDPRDQILLYNYVERGGGRTPDRTWVGLESLPNTISKVRTLATYCEEVLARVLQGADKEQLAALRHRLHAQEVIDTPAEIGLIVPALPMLPLYILFWDEEPEDDFPAKVKVLFDHQVLDILDIESLIFVAERMAEQMAALIGTI